MFCDFSMRMHEEGTVEFKDQLFFRKAFTIFFVIQHTRQEARGWVGGKVKHIPREVDAPWDICAMYDRSKHI